MHRKWKRIPLLATVLVGIFWLLSLPPAKAQATSAGADTTYLKEMPEPARVLADMQGVDPNDTAARRWGAMYQLRQIVAHMSNGRFYRGKLTPEEDKVYLAYQDAMFKVAADGRLRMRYEADKSFRDELLKRYFSAEWRTQYYAQDSSMADRIAAHKREQEELRQQTLNAYAEKQREEWTKIIVGLVVVAGYIVALVVTTKLAFRGRFGLDPDDPRKLRVGGIQYMLHSATGTVVSPTKDREVHTDIFGGYGNVPVYSKTTTITHLQFFLKQANGEEKVFQIASALADTALREGHRLSVVGAIQKGYSSRHYFLFRNHSTGQIVYDDSVLKPIVKQFGGRTTPAFLLSACSGIGLAVYYGVRGTAVDKRMQLVKRQIGERLIPQLDSQQ